MKEPIFWTPLRPIIRTALLLLVGLLTSGCADANKDGIPLQALLDNDLAKVERALQRGADPDRFRDKDIAQARNAPPGSDLRWALGSKPFFVVIERGGVEMAELLLRYGMDPDDQASLITGQTFLQYAERRKRYDIMAVLIRAGADLNSRGVTSYANLAKMENDDVLMRTIFERLYSRDEKACPNVVWSINDSFFRYYFSERDYTLVEPLLEAGVNPNLDDPRDFSALVSALSIEDKQLRERVLRALIRHGARIDLATIHVRQMGFVFFKDYVLHAVAMEGLTASEIDMLLKPMREQGLPYGDYLHLLISSGKLEMPVEYNVIFNSPLNDLLIGGVRECVLRESLTLYYASEELATLHYAMAHGDIRSMKKALEAGAGPNEKFRDMSPIYYAWFYGKTLESRKAMLRLLVEHGADIREAGHLGARLENNVAALFLDTQPPELYCIVLPEHETCR